MEEVIRKARGSCCYVWEVKVICKLGSFERGWSLRVEKWLDWSARAGVFELERVLWVLTSTRPRL